MASLLLVDDDDDLAETLRELFELLDHQVDVAGHGAEALGLMFAKDYTLVLLDWQLPDMSGLEVCRQYRSEGGKAMILMLTGMRDDAARNSCSDAGADSLLTKPFTVDVLTERVQELLCN